MSPVHFLTALCAAASVAASAGLSPTGVSAAGSHSASSRVSNVMTPPNSAPTGVADAYEVVENGSLHVAAPIGVLANDSDPDGDPISLTGATQPPNGLLQISPLGSFAYTPDSGFSGVDSFLYDVSDDRGNSTGLVVEVFITVIPESTDPTTTIAVTTTSTEPAAPSSTAAPTIPTDPAEPTTASTVVEPDAGIDAAPPTDPLPADPVGPVAVGAVEPAGDAGPASGTTGAVVTTTLPATLPATGVESIALGLGALLFVVGGAVVSGLGTIATHGARRAGRGHHVRRR